MENYEIVSRLLEGNFIDYKAAIPLTATTTAKVTTRNVIECIERTSLIITDKSSPVRCVVEDGVMKFSSVTVQSPIQVTSAISSPRITSF